MDAISQLLQRLIENNVSIRLNETHDQLLIKSAKGKISSTDREDLATYKQDIIALLSANTSATQHVKAPIEKRNILLNRAQQAIYLDDQRLNYSLDGNMTSGSIYHLPLLIELSKGIDKELLISTLNNFSTLHPVIQSEVKALDGQLFFTPHKNQSWTVQELSCDDQVEFEHTIVQLHHNLNGLFQCHLVNVQQQYYLFINIHHVICDIQSAQQYLADFIALFNGRETPNQHLQNEQPYTISHKDDIRNNTIIECDLFNHEKKHKNNIETQQQQILELSSHAIQGLCAKFNCSKFELFLTSLCLSIYKFTYQTSFHISIAKTLENNLNTQNLTIQHALIFIDFSQTNHSTHFSDIIKLCRQAIDKSHAIGEFSQEQISQYRPILFSFNETQVDQSFLLGDVQATIVDLQSHFQTHIKGSKNNATNIIQSPWHLNIAIDYKVDASSQIIQVQSKSTINKDFSQSCANFIHAILSQLQKGSTNLSALSLLSTNHQQAMVKAFRKNHHASYITESSIQEMFEEQVLQSPCSIALSRDDSSLSYQQLNTQANKLAHYIQQQYAPFITSSEYIAISMDRSEQLIIAILAILKAGFAYIPIAKHLAPKHQQQILDDAKPLLIINDNQHTVSSTGIPTLYIHDTSRWQTYSVENPQRLNNQLKPILNVIYTSGTTGQPKGIKMSQKAMLAHLLWMKDELNIKPTTKILHKTPISFDVSVWEIFLPLIVGAEVSILNEHEHKEPAAILLHLERHQINVCHFVPSMLSALIPYLSLPDNKLLKFKTLHHIICSGETLTSELYKQSQQYFSYSQLHNFYGPTEAAIDISSFNVTEKISSSAGLEHLTRVPIGKAVANTELYILDPHHCISANGAKGELFIASVQLAEGYLNLPKKTNDNFIYNPFFLEGSRWPRLYKTGDFVKSNQDHQLEFIERVDLQIKLRGQRFELEGLNQLLASLIKSHNVCCLLSDDQQTITAFYDAKLDIDPQSLQEDLSAYIEPQFIPKKWFQIDIWPINNNGKLDRSQLKEKLPLSQKIKNQQQLTPDKFIEITHNNPLVISLLDIFRDKLSLNIDLSKSFIENGGHSLVALSITHKIFQDHRQHINNQCFVVNVSITQLIYYIADQISGQFQYQKHYTTKFHHLNNEMRREWLEAEEKFDQPSLSQQSILNFEALETGYSQYNLPIAYTFSSTENNQQSIINGIQKALCDCIQHHPALQTTYPQFNSVSYANEISIADIFTHQILNPSIHLTTTTLRQLAENEASRTINISTKMPIRAILFQKNNQFLLCITLHHIAVDAISLAILSHDFKYALSNTLPYEHTQPSSFIKNYAYSQVMSGNKNTRYWTQQLRDISPYFSLHRHKDRENNFIAKSSSIELSQLQSNQLFAAAQKQSTSVQQLLLSAFHLIAHSYSQQNTLAIATTINGRSPELNNSVGMFVNTIPAISNYKCSMTLHEYLTQQQQQFKQANHHQDINIDAIAQQLKISRKLNQLPYAQLGFNLLTEFNQQDTTFSYQNSTFKAIDFSSPFIKNELNLTPILCHHHLDNTRIRLRFDYSEALFTDNFIHVLQQYYLQLLLSISSESLKNSNILIEALLENIGLNSVKYEVQDQDPLELSPTQRDIYIDDLIQQNSIKNHIAFITHSTTDLDILLWEQAVYDCYTQFDALRAHVKKQTNQLKFVISAPSLNSFKLAYKHYTRHDDYQSETMAGFIHEAIINPSLIEKDQLWRSALISTNQQQSVFTFVAHHALLDGISLEIIGRSIKDRYQELLVNPEKESNKRITLATNKKTKESIQDKAILLSQLFTEYEALDIQTEKLNHDTNISHLPVESHNARSAGTEHIQYAFSENDWAHIQTLCKSLRTTPATYFKALFSLAIKSYFNLSKTFAFYEVISGRNNETVLDIGVLFEQEVNFVPTSIKADSSFKELLKHFSQLRKKLKNIPSFSPSELKQIFPNLLSFVFNFYIMETSTDFLGGKESVEHVKPEINENYNFITSIINNRLSLDFYYPSNSFHGSIFIQQLLAMNTYLMQCDDIKNIRIQTLCPIKNISVNINQLLTINQLIDHQNSNPSKNEIQIKQTDLEQSILSIWRDVLGVQNIQLNSNFFELGGHSLQAVDIAQRLQSILGIQLQLTDLLNDPTINGLVGAIIEGRYTINALSSPKAQYTHLDDYTTNYHPLSFNQKRLWFLQSINPKLSANFLIRAAFEIHHIDLGLLEQAISVNIDNDINYRLSPRSIDNSLSPLQCILDEKVFSIEHSQRTKDNFSDLINNIEMPLTEGKPLVRIFVNQDTRRLSDSIQLGFIMHHFISDAKTLELFALNCLKNYKQLQLGMQINAVNEQLNYVDYIYSQQKLKQHDHYQNAIEYWVHLLSPLNYLPIYKNNDLKSLNIQTAKSVNLKVEPSIVQDLQQVSQELNVSLFTLTLCAYGQAISAISDKRRLPISLPRDGRNHALFANTPGFFTNAIIFKYDNSVYQTLSHMLREQQAQLLNSYSYDFIDIDDISSALKIPRNIQHIPYSQFAFNFSQITQSQQQQTQQLIQEFGMAPIELTNDIAKFECLMNAQLINNELNINIEFNVSTFNQSSMANFSNHFIECITLLSTLNNHNKNLSSDDLIQHCHQRTPKNILQAYDLPLIQYSQDYIDNGCAFNLLNTIEKIASLYSDNEAIKDTNTSLTYSDLHHLSSNFAYYLLTQISFDTERQIKCLIILGNSVELIVTLIALWKANIHYCIIDDKLSAPLIKERIKAFSPDHIITQSTTKITAPNIYFVDQIFEKLPYKGFISQPVRLSSPPDGLAYSQFTSGSTGKPKIISIRRSNFERLIYWFIHELQLNECSSTIVFSSPQFDLSTKNYFGLLCTGGTIQLDNGYYDPQHLSRTLSNNKYTYINCSPTALYPILEFAQHSNMPCLVDTIMLGGETIKTTYLYKLLQATHFTGTLINSYGPAECTDITLFQTLNMQQLKLLAQEELALPLGQAMPFSSAAVFDNHHAQMPTGFSGNLAISGQQLACNIDTANINGVTYYQSGDKVSLKIFNQVQYMFFEGREDSEVKIHGQRVNLQALQKVFEQHLKAPRTEIIVDDNQLIAFISKGFKSKYWRETLAKVLNYHFLPSQLIEIEQWPITTNGKLDTKSLLTHKSDDKNETAINIQTLNNDVKDYFNIIQHNLPDNIQSLNDNFFMLGGHSLSLIQLCNMLNQTYNIRLNPSDVFLQPSIRAILQSIQTAQLFNTSHAEFACLSSHAPSNQIVIGFPALGFSPYSFQSFSESLGEDITFYAINYAAIDFSKPTALIDACINIIKMAKVTNVDLQFVGHSIGGAIAANTMQHLTHGSHEYKFNYHIKGLLLLDALLPNKLLPQSLNSYLGKKLFDENLSILLEQPQHQYIESLYQYFRTIKLSESDDLKKVELIKANHDGLVEGVSSVKNKLQDHWAKYFPHITISDSHAGHVDLILDNEIDLAKWVSR